MKRGKFITIYGINGIGKTTQVNLLVDNLKKQGK
ncbi:MAG: dTMP kinase, partial [Candidatus Moranbacteria bacterium]|nr:dTMP kinase [Candidatus Moranbacteria bacterium]